MKHQNQMGLNEALLPCPFCGSKAVMSTYYIECAGENGCDVSPNVDKMNLSEAEAIKRWNTRAEPIAPKGDGLGEAQEDAEFAAKLAQFDPTKDYGSLRSYAGLLSARLRQMDKRAKAANKRADSALQAPVADANNPASLSRQRLMSDDAQIAPRIDVVVSSGRTGEGVADASGVDTAGQVQKVLDVLSDHENRLRTASMFTAMPESYQRETLAKQLIAAMQQPTPDTAAIECIAREVYKSMVWAAQNHNGSASNQEWTEGGNSMAQTEARGCAQVIAKAYLGDK